MHSNYAPLLQSPYGPTSYLLKPGYVFPALDAPKRRKLGIDMDGVLADFTGAYARIAKQLFGIEIDPSKQVAWDFECQGIDSAMDDEIWNVINNTFDFWYAFIEPMPGANSLFMAYQYHDLFFITSRTPTRGVTPALQTADWLCRYHGINRPTVIVVDPASKKVQIAKALDIDAFVEDKPSTVKLLRDAGIKTYVFDQPYNRDLEGPRVYTVNEFLEVAIATHQG